MFHTYIVSLHGFTSNFLTWGWKLTVGLMVFYAIALVIAFLAEKRRNK